MTAFRFIHCSDLHIDSPFKGLSGLPEALAARLREAPHRAWENIVRLAVRERVDAVLIAGDVYDGAERSLQAQLRFRRGLQTLAEAGIPAFVAHGNHDPLDGWSHRLNWPEPVTVFPGDAVRAVAVRRDGRRIATVYGISFPEREVRGNLTPLFKREKVEGYHIGLLHANVGGRTDHDPYAPCTLDDLIAPGLDYWALGHIHKREILRPADPAVVYCGNPQGRHFRETGAKGCCLVTLRPGAPPEIEFVPVDAARYQDETVDVSDCASLDALLDRLERRLRAGRDEAEERPLVARLTLAGRTPLHRELARPGTLESLADDLVQRLPGPPLWVVCRPGTRGGHDLDRLRQGHDFIADLLAQYESLAQGPEDAEARAALDPLFREWVGHRELEPVSDAEWRVLLERARDLTLDHLTPPEA